MANANRPPSKRQTVSAHAGDGLEVARAAGEALPDVVVLWLSGWEGHQWLHRQIELAAASLAAGGHFCLVTSKQRGASTHRKLVQAVFGNAGIAARRPDGTRVLLAVRPAIPVPSGPALALSGAARHSAAVSPSSRSPETDSRPMVEAEVLGHQFVFRTAPGVFSHQTLNPGTRLLIECLHHEALHHNGAILDLGCGYGVIGIVLAKLYPCAMVTLVDVDARAVRLAEMNVTLNSVPAEVRLSDGLRHLPRQTFDVIASHFPLHIPRQEQKRLLAEAQTALATDGELYLAALDAYDLRPLVRSIFGHVETLTETMAAAGARYRVIRVRQERRGRRSFPREGCGA